MALNLHGLLLRLALIFGQAQGAIPGHAKFYFEAGVISATMDPKLRVNVKGGHLEPGDPLILWPCSPHSHELFKFEDGLIKLESKPDLCLNAAGGAAAGMVTNITTFPCEQGGTRVPHEEFLFGQDGRIRPKDAAGMCFNVEGGEIKAGAKVILYPCAEPASANEQFAFEGGLIKVKNRPELHLNVQGGELEAGKTLVLWGCQAAAHEMFEFSGDGKLRVAGRNHLCVNAERGLGAGHKLIVYPCSQGPADNEQWEYDPTTKVIGSTVQPKLGFNVKEASVVAGAEIVLWPLEHEEL